MISETKLDETFSETQFFIDAFASPYTMDRNAKFKCIALMLDKIYHADKSLLKIMINI